MIVLQVQVLHQYIQGSQNTNTADVGEEVGVLSQNAVTRKGRNGRTLA